MALNNSRSGEPAADMELLAILSLPLLVRQIRSAEFGASGQQRAIAMIDLQTAQLHAAFGLSHGRRLIIDAIAARR